MQIERVVKQRSGPPHERDGPLGKLVNRIGGLPGSRDRDDEGPGANARNLLEDCSNGGVLLWLLRELDARERRLPVHLDRRALAVDLGVRIGADAYAGDSGPLHLVQDLIGARSNAGNSGRDTDVHDGARNSFVAQSNSSS